MIYIKKGRAFSLMSISRYGIYMIHIDGFPYSDLDTKHICPLILPLNLANTKAKKKVQLRLVLKILWKTNFRWSDMADDATANPSRLHPWLIQVIQLSQNPKNKSLTWSNCVAFSLTHFQYKLNSFFRVTWTGLITPVNKWEVETALPVHQRTNNLAFTLRQILDSPIKPPCIVLTVGVTRVELVNSIGTNQIIWTHLIHKAFADDNVFIKMHY